MRINAIHKTHISLLHQKTASQSWHHRRIDKCQYRPTSATLHSEQKVMLWSCLHQEAPLTVWQLSEREAHTHTGHVLHHLRFILRVRYPCSISDLLFECIFWPFEYYFSQAHVSLLLNTIFYKLTQIFYRKG